MTVAILGGAGYIGSHVVKFLRGQGVPLVVYDNLSQGHREAVLDAPLVVGEIGDADRLGDCLKRHQVKAVMDFAALIAVGESVKDPARYYACNVGQTLAMLDTLLAHGVRDFVFSSTCAIYGMPRALPLTEDHPTDPINPYGRTKLAIEHALADYARAYDFRYVSMRYFNASGADPAGELGEDHQPETHLIPLLLDAVLGRRQALDIFGTDYDTPDGTCVRDYIHVWDLAQAHWLALQWLRETARSDAFNLGNGAGHSVKEVVASAERVTGRSVPVRLCPRRDGDPPVLIGSSARAITTLGWQPVYADLDAILSTAWNWQRKWTAQSH
ncbi:MAG: UDP-glucose 4-epimerase GalE [Candidatus Sericytochromatia bacterium]